MYYGEKEFIKAHQSWQPFYNHSYDRYVRYVFCKKCKAQIGIQQKYPDFQTEFNFGSEKDNYKCCPYCGHKFKKG